jgi:hypothetical protein
MAQSVQSFSSPNRDGAQTSRYTSVVSELVWTEEKYVQGLERLSTLKCIVYEQAILSTDEVNEVFGNVDALLEFHSRFLKQVASIAVLPDQEQDWSTAFSTFKDAADMYVTYIANHESHLDAALREQERMVQAIAPAGIMQQVSDRHMIYHTFQWPYSRFAKYSCLLKVRGSCVVPCASYNDAEIG